MTTTVIKHHSDANDYLKKISIRSIKDVRALDVDLMLVLVNGDRIIINNGALDAMGSPPRSPWSMATTVAPTVPCGLARTPTFAST